MPKKENNQNGLSASLGEIGTIRDILMGPQMEEFSSQIKHLQQVINRLESKIESLETISNDSIKNLENQTQDNLKAFKNDTENRFEQLEKSLEENIEALKDDDRSNRERIAKLLLEAGNSLLED